MVRMPPRIKRQFQIQRVKRHFWIQIGAVPFLTCRQIGRTGAESLQSLLRGGKAAHGLSIATKCRFKEADLGLGYVECFAPLLAASRSRCSASVSSLSHPDNNVMARTMTPPALDRLRLQDMALPLCSEGTSTQLFAFKSGMARGYSRRAEKWRFCFAEAGQARNHQMRDDAAERAKLIMANNRTVSSHEQIDFRTGRNHQR